MFCPQKLKKPPSKVAQKNSNPLFFLTTLTAQTAQTEEFIFQNVAYRPTVYRTGVTAKEKSLGTYFNQENWMLSSNSAFEFMLPFSKNQSNFDEPKKKLHKIF